MTRSYLFLFIINFLILSSANALVVTSLNIEWFGRGGEIYGTSEDEYRGQRLQEFISTMHAETDVFVFQEITDKNAIYALMNSFECISYDMPTDRHQFIVMCSKVGLLQSQRVNHEVRLNKLGLRAALIGEYLYNGAIIQVIGLHLKAGKSNTVTRLEQLQALQLDLKNKISHSIVIGDFNTYTKDRTELNYDDSFYVNHLLGPDYSLIDSKHPTYMGFGGRYFDRVWTKGFKVNMTEVKGPCNQESVPFPFSDRGFYKRFISDHCSLSIKVGL